MNSGPALVLQTLEDLTAQGAEHLTTVEEVYHYIKKIHTRRSTWFTQAVQGFVIH